jgi:hypothetical protein
MSWRMDKISSLGLPTHPKKYPRGTSVKAWGWPEAPLLHRQKSGHLSTHYIFIASYIIHFSWSVSCFYFLVLFSFVWCNKWLDPNKFLLEKLPCFSFAKNTPFFTLIVQWVFSFSATTFSFHFSPWFGFRSCYIFASRCILTSGPYWFSSKELLQKGSNGVGKEKKIMQKSGTKRSLFRPRLRLLHVVLDVFLIVCLVVLL